VLVEQGYDVTILTRGPGRDRGRIRSVTWDARTLGLWAAELEGASAVVNLVGRTVDCRKTAENKRIIVESRVDSVRALGEACGNCTRPPAVWVQTSTAHIYGDTADELLDESSPIGQGFAPQVGVAWERALEQFAPAPEQCRRVVLRISFVLGRHGGALRTLKGLRFSFPTCEARSKT
jgi:NAD dependent epimerase/dehydratase family enzyme